MKFSIIVVSLNPGEKLKKTLDSIFAQTYTDYEVVLKDGGSTDGSVEMWKGDAEEDMRGSQGDGSFGCDGGGLEATHDSVAVSRLRFFCEPDKGIYDAMNQAVAYAKGEFILFLNCGDLFADEKVLERTAAVIDKEREEKIVLYGDTISEKNGVVITAPPEISGFTCYRNIPCHQSCFYSAVLCREKSYDLQYKIRADYEHFLWCFYQAGAKMVYLDFPVAVYEGGGYSESKANLQRDEQEHKKITEAYIPKKELLKYRTIMALTLAPLRRKMAENKLLSGFYHWVKENIYRRKKWFFLAILFMLLEMALLIWPVGWIGEEVCNYLRGEGNYVLQVKPGENSFCQVFSPEYRHLKSIGIIISEEGTEGINKEDGTARIIVSDEQNEILFCQDFPYTSIAFDTYMDFEMNLKLSPQKDYYLTVILDESGNAQPSLKVCGTEYYMAENRILYYGDEVENTQLLTQYKYTKTISKDKLLKTIILCLCTAMLIALKFPQSKSVRRVIGCLVLWAIPFVLGARLELLTIDTSFLLPFALLWNICLMLLFEVILLLCTNSLWITAIAADGGLTVLYSANYFMYKYRGAALKWNDFAAAGTAAKVIKGYSLAPNSHLAMIWCIAVLLAILAFKARNPLRWRFQKAYLLKRTVTFAAGVAIAVISGYQLLYTDMLVDNGFLNFRGIEQHMTYRFDGYLVASCLEIQGARVEKPEGYSTKRVENILSENRNDGTTDLEELPHIIVIMNESFSDLRVLGNLEASEEYMEFINSLQDNTVRGYVNVSVLGGGTANSEFELFTGCSMGFLPKSYYAYLECVKKPKNSLISMLNDNGYTTYSMHPEEKSNWNRETIYQYLGFDKSFWKEDFGKADMIHTGISDRSTYQKIIELYENRGNDKIFIFDLTMQNHGDYTEKEKEPDYKISFTNITSSEANVYLPLIKESDEALKELVNYFEKQNDKVIICMFGDHQPRFNEEGFYEKIYEMTPELTEIDKVFNQYKTPFVIWANYDIEEQRDLDISINYLGPLLLKTAKIEGSAYFNYLSKLMEDYPIITVNGYLDDNGILREWSGENDEFPDYRMLQYNYLFDRDNVDWGF